MRLPNAQHAVVDIRKLVLYVLDTTNVRGQHKARVMASALGFTAANAEVLSSALLEAILQNDCVIGELDFYGQRYTVDCKIKTDVGVANVRSGWIVQRDEDFPRLTTCYVLSKRGQK